MDINFGISKNSESEKLDLDQYHNKQVIKERQYPIQISHILGIQPRSIKFILPAYNDTFVIVSSNKLLHITKKEQDYK